MAWSRPVEFEVNDIGFFIPQGPVSGGINRIAFNGNSAGSRLDELNKLRDAIDTLQNDDSRSPDERGAAFLAVLPTIAAPFATIRGEVALTGFDSPQRYRGGIGLAGSSWSRDGDDWAQHRTGIGPVQRQP
jgi:hypothetical protein